MRSPTGSPYESLERCRQRRQLPAATAAGMGQLRPGTRPREILEGRRRRRGPAPPAAAAWASSCPAAAPSSAAAATPTAGTCGRWARWRAPWTPPPPPPRPCLLQAPPPPPPAQPHPHCIPSPPSEGQGPLARPQDGPVSFSGGLCTLNSGLRLGADNPAMRHPFADAKGSDPIIHIRQPVRRG